MKTTLPLAVVAFVASVILLEAQPFRFTVSADNRPYDGGNRNRFQWTLTEMTRLVGDEGVFHIMPGDFDSPWITEEDLQAEFGQDGTPAVWYPVVGNHETETAADMTWVRNASLPYIVNLGPSGCEETTYSFDYGNAHFIALNEYYDGASDIGTDGDVVTELYDWLVDDLDLTDKPVVFVIGHEPAYPQVRHVGDSLDQHESNRDRFWSLLNERGVVAYFCGHTHVYSALAQGGETWQVDVGNSGNPSIDGNPQTFVDVVVTAWDVTFTVYQGFQNEAFALADTWTVSLTPVAKATQPSPYHGATDQPVDLTLSWTVGAGAMEQELSLWHGPVSIEDRKSVGLASSYQAPLLAPDTTYQWWVDTQESESVWHPGDLWTFTTAPLPSPATLIGPASGSIDVPVDALLEWTAGAHATSHDVYLGIDETLVSEGDPSVSLGNQSATVFDPGLLDPNQQYFWRIDERGPGGVTPGVTALGEVWTFTTGAGIDVFAQAEVLVGGTVLGTYEDTHVSDHVREEITERESGGKPSKRHSWLEHKWIFDVPAANNITFYVEAQAIIGESEEAFEFAFSTDDDVYTRMFAISSGMAAELSWPLPQTLAGTVYVRVTDTDRTSGNRALDTVAIDAMRITCGGSAEPDNEPPTTQAAWDSTGDYPIVTSSTITLKAQEETDPSGVEYKFDNGTLGTSSDWQDSPIYTDSNLTPQHEYSYVVTVQDKLGNGSDPSTPMATFTATEGLPAGLVTYLVPLVDEVVNRKLVLLEWTQALNAASYDVYLGMNDAAVLSADPSSAEYMGNQLAPVTTYASPILRKGTYYYRVDALNADGIPTVNTVLRSFIAQ